MRTNSHFGQVSSRKSTVLIENGRGLGIAQVAATKLKISFNFAEVTGGFEEEMTLDMIPKDGIARVVSVESTDSHSLRLMEMGLVPGAAIRMVKSAPLGDPIQVCIRNYDLALRRDEAKSIVVTLDETDK